MAIKPWLGALAVAVAMAVAPAVAHADGAVSLMEFKVPDQAALDRIGALGADVTENVRPSRAGGLVAQIVVDDSERAQLEALGYPALRTVFDERDAQALKAERETALAEDAAALAGARSGRAAGRARSLAADTVRAQRADYFVNYAGRFLSIEAVTSDGAGHPTNPTYTGPALSAVWDSGPQTAADSGGTTPLSVFVDDGVYLYHYRLVRVGDVDDGKPMPSSVRIASSGGGVDTLAVKEWTSKDGKGFPATFGQDFNSHYVDPQEGYARVRALAAAYPDIADVIELPNRTAGYQRKAQAIVGPSTPYNPQLTSLSSAGTISAAQAAQAVVVTSLAWGQEGGNDLSIRLVDPGVASAPLGVAVSGDAIVVDLATDGQAVVTSTAAQVVAALNAGPAAALVTASRYQANAGAGIVAADAAATPLRDFLKAPASVPRGPQQPLALRIGKARDGTKVGVFIYCQEHAREWATPLVCLETAQRLVANYGTDPETTALVDGLDIFIVPTINADGAMYSMYDFTSQRKNLVNYCAANPTGANDPASRNRWGVDLNRNFSVGSVFDGYAGASATNCTSDTFAGPFEFSEPETRNEQFIQSTFPNIRFAMNVHSSGGYFMWPPGAYRAAGRVPLPYASYGVNQYFEQTAATVLDRVKGYRGTVVTPAQTGPVIDVLYSAAGNSADEAYYTHGIIGYDFEVGADRFTGAGTDAVGVGFTPSFAEGHDEGMEFANGNYALLDSALDYANDTTAPVVSPTGPSVSATPYDVRFAQSEAAEIHYTTDGSTPTEASPTYQPARPRALPEPIHIAATTTLRWIAKDFKGNVSTGSKTLYLGTQAPGTVTGTVPATLALTFGASASFGAFTPGVARDYTASTVASVLSTAGDAALSVADPSATATGHLVNGAFWLPQALAAGAGGPFAPVGGAAAPTLLKTWTGPTSNEAVPVTFKQSIAATDALRTGAYAKTLTFTLSTTSP